MKKKKKIKSEEKTKIKKQNKEYTLKQAIEDFGASMSFEEMQDFF